MPLNLEFCPDLEWTFFNSEEFAHRREFEIIENGVPKVFWTTCIWDTETLKTRPIVQQQGLFLGTVLLFIHKNLFQVEPKPDQILYSPVTPFRIGWRIVDVTDAEECFEIYLDKMIA